MSKQNRAERPRSGFFQSYFHHPNDDPDLLPDPHHAAPPPKQSFVNWLVRVLRWVSFAMLAAGCVGLFYVAVILGETPRQQQGTDANATPVPAMVSMPEGIHSVESTDVSQLAALFTRPLAELSQKQGFVVVSGKVEDIRLGDASETCRVVSIAYTHVGIEGEVVLVSVSPGDYIRKLAKQGFQLDPRTASLGRLPAVILTLNQRQYYVAANGDTEYVLEADSPETLATVCSWVEYVGFDLPEAQQSPRAEAPPQG